MLQELDGKGAKVILTGPVLSRRRSVPFYWHLHHVDRERGRLLRHLDSKFMGCHSSIGNHTVSFFTISSASLSFPSSFGHIPESSEGVKNILSEMARWTVHAATTSHIMMQVINNT